MEYINLTPHCVTIVQDGGSTIEFLPSGQLARVEEVVLPMPSEDGIPMCRLAYGDVVGIPDDAGPTYVVARPVLEAAKRKGLPYRLVVPYPLVRDDAGRVIGCGGFASL